MKENEEEEEQTTAKDARTIIKMEVVIHIIVEVVIYIIAEVVIYIIVDCGGSHLYHCGL